MDIIAESQVNDMQTDHFSSEDYLNEYYSDVIQENKYLLEFFTDVVGLIDDIDFMLEYGGGPTIYQLISLSTKCNSIHFADYLESNLAAVKLWDDHDTHAHDWTKFIIYALETELGRHPTKKEIRDRQDLVSKKIDAYCHVDAFNPVNDTIPRQSYSMVSSNFVAESIAGDENEWKLALSSALSYVGPGGYYVTSAIRNATYWKSGNQLYKAHSIDMYSLVNAISNEGFEIILSNEIDADQTNPTHEDYEGYDGMIFVLARKKL